MNEWIKKNNEKVIYALAIIVIVLLISLYSTRSKWTQEVAAMGKTHSDLTAASTAKDTEIGDAKEKIDELTKSIDASKAETEKLTTEKAQLTTSNGELSDKVKSLEASLIDARVEIDRLGMVALLRKTNVENLKNNAENLKNNVENLKNEVGALKRTEAESGEVIAELRRGAEAADTMINQLKEKVESLSGTDN